MPAPVTTLMLPPASDAEPAAMTTEEPMRPDDEPPSSDKLPAEPETDEPVDTMTEPEAPLLLAPLPITTLPLVPVAPAPL